MATQTTTPAPSQRAENLLGQMTLEEKAMQLSSVVPLAIIGADGPIRSQLETMLGKGIGHVAGIGLLGHKLPDEIARSVNAVQRYLVTETRLKIPAIFHNEALNGVVSPGFTAYPTPIGLAATWDPDAVREMADIMRRQMRSVGMLHALAPVMDVARDARWGRVTETYGEDPYLVSAMSIAFTQGMQGEDLTEGVIACAKHFVGYAATEAGQNMAAVTAGRRELRDVHARPFEAAIRVAGLAGVMASYSEFDGVPIHTSRAVLTDLLRNQLGFTGTVVSDYNGIGWAQTRQLVAETAEEVGALGVAAGMDVEAPSPYGYGQALVRAVQDGLLSEEQLDESVRRVLRDKFALGLFENPFVAEDAIEISARAGEGVELSRRLAEESVTLLENDNDLLPLSLDIRKIAVIGPHADTVMVGFPHYTYPAGVAMIRVAAQLGFFPMPGVGELPKEGFAALTTELGRAPGSIEDYARAHHPTMSLAEAIRQLLPEAEVTAVEGCGVLPANPSDIPAAVEAARQADVVILYIGGKAGWYGDDLTEKEGGDTADIDLPRQQVDLVTAVTDVGKPTVGVVAFGRPQGLTPVIDRLPAVITDYYGGPHQAVALADAIFGVTTPPGKLPLTLPRHVGQVPIHHGQNWGSGYRRTKDDIHRGYLDMPSTPLFAFGHGLSYTTFEYGPLKVDAPEVDTSGSIRATVTITNTGNRLGTEVAQLYASDRASGVTLPAQQLVAFARVRLAPSESRTVTFDTPLSVLAYTGSTGETVMEPGPIELSVGSGSDAVKSTATVTVTGPSVTIGGEERAFTSMSSVE